MKKVCFVIQRYGLEVNGGAELHCRQLAEHLASRYEVEVITTKAKDYVTWRNEYDNDTDIVNGITVHRFANDRERVIDRSYIEFSSHIMLGEITLENGYRWLEVQGPYCPALVEYIKAHRDDYDTFIFFTYLYYTTVMGLPEVADKAILIPTAHDELPIYQPVFDEFFPKVRYFFFNTVEEKDFITEKFGLLDAVDNGGHGGVGVDLPSSCDGARFRERYGVEGDYILYIGRIAYGKRCDFLFDYFRDYKMRNHGDLKLVLMGRVDDVSVPDSPDILSLGFLDDQDKFDGIAGARALVQPSPFESLSMVVLEAMALSKPILVNAESSVLKGHCLRSDGGLYYEGYFEFEGALNYLLDHPDAASSMGANGKRYVRDNYTWDVIIDALSAMIEEI